MWPYQRGSYYTRAAVSICKVMVATGPGPFFYVIAFVLLVLNVWATIVVIRAGSRYLERTRPPRPARPVRPPLFPKDEPPQPS